MNLRRVKEKQTLPFFYSLT